MATTRKPRARVHEATEPKRRPNLGAVLALLVLTVVVLSGAYFLGKSDNGAIDVSAAIESSNAVRRQDVNDGEGQVNAVPPQFQNATNGGLVPTKTKRQPVPETPPTESEAETSNTTDAISEDRSQPEGEGTEGTTPSESPDADI